MNKKALPAIIAILGLLLVIYGYAIAPVSNESEIRRTYKCDRITKEYLSTDVYCSEPASAPEAKKQILNFYVYSGVVFVVLGSAYFVINLKRQDK